MKYKGKTSMKVLMAAGLMALSLSGCDRPIKGYSDIEQIENFENEFLGIEDFKKKLQEDFLKMDVTLNKSSDEFVSSIIIDGTDVSIELTDGTTIAGTLHDLSMSDVTFENFYVYDSHFIDDLYNADERYKNYKEKGYKSVIDELYADYEKHTKLKLTTNNCVVNNEYKNGEKSDIDWSSNIDYSNCKSLWIENEFIVENEFSSMPNLETLILTNMRLTFLDEEVIKIKSNSLKNIIIDGTDVTHYIDYFDFTQCPNLEIVSIPNDSQEQNLNGLKGLKKLKEVAFGLPNYQYNLSEKILGDFKERINLVSKPFPADHQSLAHTRSNFVSDISGINGSEIEVLNISFLNRVNSNMLLETVKSLPNLEQIVGFEIDNAGMCSDELIEYCEKHEIQHPFTQKSLDIKHKLTEIVSSVLTEDMDDEEKIEALSKYVISHMEYDYDLVSDKEKSPEEIKKGWGESLYYSVMEGKGVCQGYAIYAQNLFTEADITSFKIEGLMHTWNLVQIDDEYYFVDLTNVDSQISEEESNSFDNYNWDTYYLVPVDEEWPFYTYTLPVDAEEEYNKAKEEREENTTKSQNYKIQIKKQDLGPKSYSEFCGIIGVLSALGLAKQITNEEKRHKNVQNTEKEEVLESRKGVIQVNSLNKLFGTLKRIQKIEMLRNKKNIAIEERNKNEKVKALEIEAKQIDKGKELR